MSSDFAILLLVIIVGFAAMVWFLKSSKTEPKKDDQSLLMLQNQLNEMRATLDNKLGESTKFITPIWGVS